MKNDLDSKTPSAPTAHEPGAFSAWGLILGGALGLLPALLLQGRWYAVAALLAAAGWVAGAIVERSRR